MIIFVINNKINSKKHIIITGVYDFLLKTQLLVGGYIYNFLTNSKILGAGQFLGLMKKQRNQEMIYGNYAFCSFTNGLLAHRKC